MNIRQIEAFRAVMQAGTITGAAEMLLVSQPAVSKLIANLEAACGYALFVRGPGRILPTAEAEQFYARVEQLFVGVDQIRRASEDIRNQVTGELAIAAFPSLASRVLPRLVTGFLAERSDLRITLHSIGSRRVVERVAAQQVDMGLSIVPSDHPGIRAEHLHRLDRVCVLPAGHRLAGRREIFPHDLRDEPFISLVAEDPDRLAIEKIFSDLGVQRKIQVEAQHSDSACAFVASGAGVTIIDPFTPMEYGSERIVTRKFVPAAYMNIWLLWPTHRMQPNVALTLAATLRKGLKSVLHEKVGSD